MATSKRNGNLWVQFSWIKGKGWTVIVVFPLCALILGTTLMKNGTSSDHYRTIFIHDQTGKPRLDVILTCGPHNIGYPDQLGYMKVPVDWLRGTVSIRDATTKIELLNLKLISDGEDPIPVIVPK
jgi:hypothetical protein